MQDDRIAKRMPGRLFRVGVSSGYNILRPSQLDDMATLFNTGHMSATAQLQQHSGNQVHHSISSCLACSACRIRLRLLS